MSISTLDSELFNVENRALYHHKSDLILVKLDKILHDIAVAQPRRVGTDLPTKCFSAPAFDYRKSTRCRHGAACPFNSRGDCWFSHQPPSILENSCPSPVFRQDPVNLQDRQDPVIPHDRQETDFDVPLDSKLAVVGRTIPGDPESPALSHSSFASVAVQTEFDASIQVPVDPRFRQDAPPTSTSAEVQAAVELKDKSSDAHRVRTTHRSTSTPSPSPDRGQPDEFEDALLDRAMRSSQPQRHGQSSPVQPVHRALSTFLLLFLCLTACQPKSPAPVSWYEQTLEDEAYDKISAAPSAAYAGASSSTTRALNREITKIYRSYRRTEQDQLNSSKDSVPESSAVPACPSLLRPMCMLAKYFTLRNQVYPLERKITKIIGGLRQTQQDLGDQHDSSEESDPEPEPSPGPAGPPPPRRITITWEEYLAQKRQQV